MSKKIRIAVDAMGGDNSPKKIIDGIIHNHKSGKNNFYKIFGVKNEIESLIDSKINKDNFISFRIISINFSKSFLRKFG